MSKGDLQSDDAGKAVLFDYRGEFEVQGRRRRKMELSLGLGAFSIVVAGVMLVLAWLPAGETASSDLPNFSKPQATVVQSSKAQFEICGMTRTNCVVDGDTFWLDGNKIRIADIDTPEISKSRCASEYELGMKAAYRFRDLLNDGPLELHSAGNRDEDRYGRKLRIVIRNGRSIGDQLVKEGLARTWSGRREPWC